MPGGQVGRGVDRPRGIWRKIARVGQADGFTLRQLAERLGNGRGIDLPEEFVEELVAAFPPVPVPAGCCGTKLRRDDLSVRLYLDSLAAGQGRTKLARTLGLKESAVAAHIVRGKQLLAELLG
jgi:hypothetical protein